MSQGPLDRPTFEAIEAYLLDRMDASESEAFEQRMAADGALRAEVELSRDNIRAVELGGVARMLKGIVAEEVSSGHGASDHSWKQYVKYAAVAAIVLSGLLWLLRPSAGERLFAEHYFADPGLPVAMSATDDPAFADAMVAYKEGKYAEARTKWTPMLQAEPMNDTLRYYVASASLALDDADAAIPLLEGLSTDRSSVFQAKSQWFLFLAYVKCDDASKARAIALDNDPIHGESVRAIKARLK